MNLLRQIAKCLPLALACAPVWASSPVDSGALDAPFGSSGKVILNAAEANATGSNFTATDVAVQSNGKIVVAGYTDGDCVLARLNPGGILDTGFSGPGGFSPGFSGFGGCSYASVAVGTGDRIVAIANDPLDNYLYVSVNRFLADGAIDPSFGTYSDGLTNIIADSINDHIYVSRVMIEPGGSIDVAGTYYQQNFNGNQFFFVRLSADGKSVVRFRYQFGTGPNQDDHALDLTIDRQGRYVVAGYHRGASGNYDFAAIRIRSDLYDVDNTFGSGGQTTVDFGDNGDYANAVALTPTGYIALGGQANGQAALAFLNANGKLLPEITGYQYDTYQFAFGSGGGNDTITKLIVDRYDTDHPKLLALGSGNQSYGTGPGDAAGLMFGIARLDLPGYLTFTLDTTFAGDGTEGVDFIRKPSGIGTFFTTNNGSSATYANGKMVVVGDTLVIPESSTSPTNMAVARLAAFDGIFKNGLETPYY